ncbi:MAG: type pilus biosis/stability protein PilF [Pseudomonadota bacterium]|jgi:type IV pilus assembly protein PilF
MKSSVLSRFSSAPRPIQPSPGRPYAVRRGACLVLWIALSTAGPALLGGCAPLPSASQGPQTDVDRTDAQKRARSRLELAAAYFGRGQFDTALDDVKRALQISPDLPEAYNLRGLIYAAIGQDRLADESFRQALQLSPDDGAIMHNRAWTLCQRGAYADAQTQFEALLRLPGYRDALRTWLARGVCYGRAGQWPAAEQALMRAYELDPSNPVAGYSLAEVLHRRGDDERARFYISRVNQNADAVNAQSLWLALRIERRLGQGAAERVLGEQLRTRFPQAPETSLYEGGRFDD